MTNSHTFTLETILASLLGRVTLVIFTVMVASEAMSLILAFSSVESKFVTTIIILTILGLIAGFTSRILLWKFSRILKVLTAIVSVLIGIIILDTISSEVVSWSKWSDGSITRNLIFSLQFIWSSLISFLSVLAWSKQIHIKDKGSKWSLNSKRKTGIRTGILTSHFTRRLPQEKSFLPFFQKRFTSFRWRKLVGKPTNWIKGRFEAFQKSLLAKWKKSSKKIRLKNAIPRIKRSQNKLKLINQKELITFIGEEIHNCPYCLEPVSEKDSRGQVICPICKTWHHADCWQAAGECQVPHYH
jgi:hypothetical protein